MEAKPFQPTTGTLIGRFEKQRWAGDRAEEIETVEFDATDYILNMSAAGLRKVEDCNYSSDAIGQAHVDHEGPFSVHIEQAICTFFGVEAVSDIKSTHLRQAKAWLKSLPKKQYIARVNSPYLPGFTHHGPAPISGTDTGPKTREDIDG